MKNKLSRPAIVFIIVFLIVGAGLITAAALYANFDVKKVTVTGSTHYTEDEIKKMVMSGPLGNNSLFLKLKYRKKSVTGIPFIEKMDVVINSPHAITINVYEKAVAGYVKYLGQYMYFDREGIIVESSVTALPGIPYVTGLKFDNCVMYEPLPVENSDVFSEILSITQLLSKYEISADRIYFSKDYEITLYFGNARVSIGTMDYIDEKMMELKQIVPKLEGLSGVLHMEDYTEDSDKSYITFEKDE